MTRVRQIFDQMRSGLFHFNPEIHLQPRAPGIGPIFPPGRIAVLRKKFLLAGLDPNSFGLPEVPPKTPQQPNLPRPKFLGDRSVEAKGLKWVRVKQKLAEMPALVEEARQRRRQAKQDKKKKLPF